MILCSSLRSFAITLLVISYIYNQIMPSKQFSVAIKKISSMLHLIGNDSREHPTGISEHHSIDSLMGPPTCICHSDLPLAPSTPLKIVSSSRSSCSHVTCHLKPNMIQTLTPKKSTTMIQITNSQSMSKQYKLWVAYYVLQMQNK